MSQYDDIQPDTWRDLNETERLQSLQNIENTMAGIQGRPNLDVLHHEMPRGSFGYFDGEALHINTEALNTDDVAENVDTVIHEGRHAYQQHAVDHPGFHDDPDEVAAWANNEGENYLSAEMYGQEAYLEQPVEADAWSYASQIRQGIYEE